MTEQRRDPGYEQSDVSPRLPLRAAVSVLCLLALVLATRDPASLDPELARWTAFGASPRGTIALDRCARAMAWLEGRDYVSPDDVRNIAFDVLRHRILLTFEAEAEGLTADAIIQRLIDRVPVTA